jgi:hypothetical protein
MLLRLQAAALSVFTAISPRHPAAIPASAYRQIIHAAMNDSSDRQSLSIGMVPQALDALGRHVQLEDNDYHPNIQLALEIIVCEGV